MGASVPSTSPKMAKFSDNPISSPARTRTVKASALSIRFPDRHFHTATVHHSSAIKSRHYRPEWLSRRKQGSPSARKKLRTKEICSRLFPPLMRSEEHTSELQSLMRISYAVFCLKKKQPTHNISRTPSQQQNYYQLINIKHSTLDYSKHITT